MMDNSPRGVVSVCNGDKTFIEHPVNGENDFGLYNDVLLANDTYQVTYTHNRDGDDGLGIDITAGFGYIIYADERPDLEWCWCVNNDDEYFVRPYNMEGGYLYILSDDPKTTGPTPVCANGNAELVFGIMMSSYR